MEVEMEMEIEGEDGSKVAIGPKKTLFGRGSGFHTQDRTVSRRHVCFRVSETEGGVRVSFEVIGRNPIWVCSQKDQSLKLFRKFEKGFLEFGDRFSLSAKSPVWFHLNNSQIAVAELLSKSESETEDSSSRVNIDIDQIDLSQIDLVKGSQVTLTTTSMDHYHSQFETDAATYNADSNINREEFNRGHELHANDDDQDYVKPSFNRHHSSSGKLFVGGISWETSEESFLKYFSNFGEVVDSVIMMDKTSGRPRGFGFVTFADSAVADEVLAKEHTLDSRVVEVKRTVPREDMEATGVFKTKKIFVGGLPHFLTDDELMAYFSTYGNIALYQIMVDHNTGRSRGFGFVTFVSEDSVEKVFSAGKIHEIGGKQVEIKRAERKRFGVDYNSSSQRSYGGFGNGADGSGGHSSRGRNHGKRVVPYADPGMNGPFGQFDGSYGVNSAPAYGGYSEYGYGYGYGGPMYCFGGYGANSYGNAAGYGGIAIYGDGNAYGRAGNFYRTSGCDSDGFTPGRYHPYWR